MESMEYFQSHGHPPRNDVRGVMMSGKRKAVPGTAKAGTSAGHSSSAPTQPTKVASTDSRDRATQPITSQSAQTSQHSRRNADSSSSRPTSSASSSKNAGSRGDMAKPAREIDSNRRDGRNVEQNERRNKGGGTKSELSQSGERDKQRARDGEGDDPKKKGRSTPSPFPLAPPDPDLYTPLPTSNSWMYESSQESVSAPRRRRTEDDSRGKRTENAKAKKNPRSSRPASPDPMNLDADSRDPSLSLSPDPPSSTLRKRNARREPLRNSPDKANLPEVIVPSSSQPFKASQKAGSKRVRRELSHASSTGGESDTTPRAVRTKPAGIGRGKNESQPSGSRAKKELHMNGRGRSQPLSQGTKRVKRRVESDDEVNTPEPEDVGAAFFRQLKGMSQRDRTHEWGHGDESDIGEQLLVASQDLPSSPPTVRPDSVSAAHRRGSLTAADIEYLQDFVDPDDLCQFCGEPMPIQRTRYLQDQETELERMKWAVYEDGDLPWDITINFCETHRAEAKIIPLGGREGYPKTIDFAALPSRLGDSEFRTDMDDLMASPEDSPLFKRIVKRIGKIGRGVWKKAVKQGEKKSLDLAMVGYYGYTGRQIISYHYETLLGQNLLPFLVAANDTLSPVAPLTPREFVEHVLVPEAAIRLIMADQGWEGERAEAESDNWSAARTQAYQTWKDSTEYGKWRFRGEGPDERKLLDDVKADMRSRLDEWKDQREMAAERKQKSLNRTRKSIEVVHLDVDSSQESVQDATPRGKKTSPIEVDSSPVAPLGLRAAIRQETIDDMTEAPDTQSSYGDPGDEFWTRAVEEEG